MLQADQAAAVGSVRKLPWIRERGSHCAGLDFPPPPPGTHCRRRGLRAGGCPSCGPDRRHLRPGDRRRLCRVPASLLRREEGGGRRRHPPLTPLPGPTASPARTRCSTREGAAWDARRLAGARPSETSSPSSGTSHTCRASLLRRPARTSQRCHWDTTLPPAASRDVPWSRRSYMTGGRTGSNHSNRCRHVGNDGAGRSPPCANAGDGTRILYRSRRACRRYRPCRVPRSRAGACRVRPCRRSMRTLCRDPPPLLPGRLRERRD